MVSKINNASISIIVDVLNMILFKNLDNQNDHKKGTMRQQIKRQNIDINGRRKFFIKFIILLCFNSILYFTDEDEIYNNPNLHSEEQDEFEIPDGNVSLEFIVLKNNL